MMNTITETWCKENNIDFDLLIDDFVEHSYKQHRRGSNFYTRTIYEISEEFAERCQIPKELIGYWESEDYISDSEYGSEGPYTLYRVEQKEETVVKKYWKKV